MTLSCPGCHAKYKFRDDAASVDRTIYVKCPACGQMIMISPKINNPALMPRTVEKEEPPSELPPEIAAAIAAARGNLWRLELLDFARQELDGDQIIEQIAKGAIKGTDLIAHADRNDWKRVEEVHEFRAALAAASPPAPEEKQGEPEEESEAPASPLQRQAPVPFWRQPGRLIIFPLAGWGLLALLGNTLFLIVIPLSYVSLLLLVFTLAYALAIIRHAAEGNSRAPGWEAFTDIIELFGNAFRLLIVTAVAWAPVILLNALIFRGPLDVLASSSGAGPDLSADEIGDELLDFVPTYGLLLGHLSTVGLVLNILLATIVLLYYPMCLSLLAIFNSVRVSLSPGTILASAATLGRAYRTAVAFCISMMLLAVLADLAFETFAAQAQRPWPGSIGATLVATYCAFVALHVLGRMVHENQHILGWEVAS